MGGLEFKELNYITILLPEVSRFGDLIEGSQVIPRVKTFIKKNVNLINDIKKLEHQPKAESIHACATIIVPDDKTIHEYIPLKLMTKGDENLLVSQWEGEELERAGFLKEDILGLAQLDKYEMMLKLIKEDTGDVIILDDIPLGDSKVMQYFSNGWNSDVFHFGSPGLTSYCREMKPEIMEDLFAAISLYRPGGMEQGFHHKYVKRKNGEEEVTYYPHTEEILKDTYGIITYQEQIMKICVVVGGLLLSEADDIRKSMVKKRASEIEQYGGAFYKHATEVLKIDDEVVKDLWDTLVNFAKYTFNLSHATAYSILSYYGQWMKVYYPLQYWATAFSFADDKKYLNFLSEMQQIGGITMQPVDINLSGAEVISDSKTNNLYWALNSVFGCGEKAYSQIVDVREEGEYLSFDNFLTRNVFKGSKVNKTVIENMIITGAFDRIEMINSIDDRFDMLEYYWNYAKIKGGLDNKKFDNVGPKIWWSIIQRKLCGYALIDYNKINTDKFNNFTIDDPDKFKDYGEGNPVLVAGIIHEINVRKTRQGKSMAKIILDYNYKKFHVLLWSDAIDKIPDIINDDVIDKILFIGGVLKFDSYKNILVVQSTKYGNIELIG